MNAHTSITAAALADPHAKITLQAVADMTESLQRVTSMERINKRLKLSESCLKERTIHMLLSADLLTARMMDQGKGYTDFKLTAAGWKVIDRKPPFWMAPL